MEDRDTSEVTETGDIEYIGSTETGDMDDDITNNRNAIIHQQRRKKKKVCCAIKKKPQENFIKCILNTNKECRKMPKGRIRKQCFKDKRPERNKCWKICKKHCRKPERLLPPTATTSFTRPPCWIPTKSVTGRKLDCEFPSLRN